MSKNRIMKRGCFKFSVTTDEPMVIARFIGVTDPSVKELFGASGVKGVAKCSSDDTFSGGFGASLAVKRCLNAVVDRARKRVIRLSAKMATVSLQALASHASKEAAYLKSVKTVESVGNEPS